MTPADDDPRTYPDGRPLPEHVAFLIEALKPVADEIGL